VNKAKWAQRVSATGKRVYPHRLKQRAGRHDEKEKDKTEAKQSR